jgi:hypothetical protein
MDESLKKALSGPALIQDAQRILHLSDEQFCKLLGISEEDYWDLMGKGGHLSIHQRAFLSEAIRVAKEKGFI